MARVRVQVKVRTRAPRLNVRASPRVSDRHGDRVKARTRAAAMGSGLELQNFAKAMPTSIDRYNFYQGFAVG